MIRDNPGLQVHYDLDKDLKAIEKLKRDYKKAIKLRERTKGSLPTFEQYLKLLESTPVILGKIREMKAMDVLLRIFFSNFTITPISEGTFKGSGVSYKLNEPWNGFVENNDFVRGATLQNLLKLFEALVNGSLSSMANISTMLENDGSIIY